MENVDDLLAQLRATTDERERAQLLDAIGISLTMQQRPLEALSYSAQALEIRRLAASEDPDAEPDLAVSFLNHGGHLSALARFPEAVASHMLAHELFERHLAAPASPRRYAKNAANLAYALSCLGSFDMAARFQGAAAAVYLERSRLADEESAASLGPATVALAGYLDEFDHMQLTAPPEFPVDERLLSYKTGSLAIAQYLSDIAFERYAENEVGEAGRWALRTVRYCDLFAIEDRGFASISGQLLRGATWLSDTRAGVPLATEARLKGEVASASPVLNQVETRASAPGPQTATADCRLWCCSIRDLFLMLRDLSRVGIPASDVHTLAQRLRASGIYPARDFAHRCQPRLPDIFITYDWRHDFHALHQDIYGFLVYLGQMVYQSRTEQDPERIRHLVFDEIGLWIDFVFIDQSARDLATEVRSVLPRVIAASEVHFVLSETALLRSWCCYELALFNQRPVSPSAFPATQLEREALEPLLARPLRSFVSPSMALDYRGFAETATTMPEDKKALGKYLEEEFPEGIAGVDRLLLQASMLGDRFVMPPFGQFHGAEDLVKTAVDKWLAR